jgi:hypothetical protein
MGRSSLPCGQPGRQHAEEPNFEQRGLGIRDAFDSAFSEMVRLEHFTLDESRLWVALRITGVTEQFCYCAIACPVVSRGTCSATASKWST